MTRLRGPGIVHLDYLPAAQLATVYEKAEVFVFPSIYEGFGFPLLEAMARGVPVDRRTLVLAARDRRRRRALLRSDGRRRAGRATRARRQRQRAARGAGAQRARAGGGVSVGGRGGETLEVLRRAAVAT